MVSSLLSSSGTVHPSVSVSLHHWIRCDDQKTTDHLNVFPFFLFLQDKDPNESDASGEITTFS